MLHATIRNGEVNGEVKFRTLTKNERIVYDAISTHAKITRSDMIAMIGLSPRTVDRAIRSLKEKKLIERVGSDKTGHWKVL